MKLMLAILLLLIMLSGCNTIPFHNSYIFDNFSLKQKIVLAKKVDVDIFWEWGLVRVTGEDLYIINGFNTDSVKNAVVEERFCGKSDGNASLGTKIYGLENKPKMLKVECLYEILNTDKLSYRGLAYLLSDVLGELISTGIYENTYKIVYFEDSLNIIKGEKYNHHRAKQKTYLYENNANDSPLIWDRTIYEFSFDYNDPVYSISFKTNPEKLNGYKPLKIDPSLLPLESPKYKALKASEEKLRK